MTRAHPHVHSGWSHTGRASVANYVSASLVNDLLYATLPSATSWCNLRLRTLRVGSYGGSLIKDQKVPVSFMWSSALSPRLADWPAHVNITGFCFWETTSILVPGLGRAGEEHDELRAWLAAGSKPVLINWGSMVFDGPRATRCGRGREASERGRKGERWPDHTCCCSHARPSTRRGSRSRYRRTSL